MSSAFANESSSSSSFPFPFFPPASHHHALWVHVDTHLLDTGSLWEEEIQCEGGASCLASGAPCLSRGINFRLDYQLPLFKGLWRSLTHRPVPSTCDPLPGKDENKGTTLAVWPVMAYTCMGRNTWGQNLWS